MRKQILSGFLLFALVAGSLAPAGEVRADDFLVVMKRKTSLRLKLS